MFRFLSLFLPPRKFVDRHTFRSPLYPHELKQYKPLTLTRTEWPSPRRNSGRATVAGAHCRPFGTESALLPAQWESESRAGEEQWGKRVLSSPTSSSREMMLMMRPHTKYRGRFVRNDSELMSNWGAFQESNNPHREIMVKSLKRLR